MADDVELAIGCDEDLLPARAHARALAMELGFSRTDATLIATAISEIARNIVVHVGSGQIAMRAVREGRRFGLQIVATDHGPGIANLDTALEHGAATGKGLGLGLPGARRLMDDFEVDSSPGQGTSVTMTKWRVRDELELLRERRTQDANRRNRFSADGDQ